MTEQTNPSAVAGNSSTEGTSTAQATQNTNQNTSHLSPDGDIVFSPEDFGTGLDPENDTDDNTTPKQSKPTDQFKIKYNGQEETLTYEQMIELAQKGRNYDHVFQEKEALKNSEELKVLSQLAKESGYEDTKSYVEAMRQMSVQSKIDKRVAELEASGWDRDQAKYVADLEMKAQTTQPPQSSANDGNKELEDDFNALLNAYPETRKFTSPDQYPPEFKEMLVNGEKPVVAYSKYLANKADAERRIAEQNAQNKQRDPGSFKSTQNDGGKDNFLDGLFGK